MSYQILGGLWRPEWRRGALIGLLAALAACSGGSTEPPSGGPGTQDPNDPTTWDAAMVWSAQCASCHGDLAEGGVAPALSAWDRDRATLVGLIDETMPLGTPDLCPGGCAEAVADYLLEHLQAAPVTCDEVVHLPRGLRLLTRREYARTVHDLFSGAGGPAGAACQGLSECDARAESCVDGRCVADPCGRYTFLFEPGGEPARSVVVAGSFNGWSPDPAAGAWPLARIEGSTAWVLKRDLPEGRHSYKFVIDGERWVTDPSSPDSEPDTFGGENSVVEIQCAGGGGSVDLGSIASDFPVESRPSGYFFDNGAEAGLVSSVHVTEYMAAAERLADATLADPERNLGCAPAAPGCVTEGLRRFGARVFRRPLTDPEVTRYAALAASESDVTEGLRVALRVMFAAPDFLYRAELGTAQADGRYRLGPYEIASAMSYLFWASAPDAALLEAAASGALSTPDGRAAQARRLLEDPRARAVVSEFVVQWLGADKVLGKLKHPDQHPGFDGATRQALLEETRRFVEHVVFDGSGELSALFVADYTLANDRVADFYGLPRPGPAFARVPYADGHRAGVLGHASVLATYAHSDQSSPILRGVFVRERLLCQVFGAPPAAAGGVPEVDPNATTRERFRQHTDDEVCRSCHVYIDEIGFGFERFDAVGGYREAENGQPVDAAGAVADVEGFGAGTDQSFTSLPELAAILAGSEASKSCFATQYWRFAHGRLERPEDTCAIARLTEAFAAVDYDVQALLVATVRAPAFVTRQ